MQREGKQDPYLLQKYEQSNSFKNQVDKSYKQYCILIQQGHYINLSSVNEELFIKIQQPQHDIYIYNAHLQNTDENTIHKLSIYFIKHFNPKPSQPFTFVFINVLAKSDAYQQFRNIFLSLTIKQLSYLREFIILKPTFFHKAADFFTFNTLSKYLKSKTQYIQTAQQLCEYLRIRIQDLVDVLPNQIIKIEFPFFQKRQRTLEHQRMNFEDHKRNEEQEDSRNKFQQSVKSLLFVKPGKQTHNIQNYELSKLGIPIVVQILVYYFKVHPQGLLLEGLFRKSVSIDEQNRLLGEISCQNYDCLLDVENPHIIANLIKRFFSNLKVPIFPYDLFNSLMHDQGVKNKLQNLKNVVNRLPQTNYLSLMFLLSFLKYDVVQNSKHNMMTSRNVGICFSPCFLRSQKASQADLIYASKGAMITQMLINKFQQIFGDEQEQKQALRNSEKRQKDNFQEAIAHKILIQQGMKIQEQ